MSQENIQQSQTKLLVGITASIGILSMPIYLQVFKNEFPSLKVIMTQCSEFFIPKNSMALIVDDIYSTMFPLPEKRDKSHISLGAWADVMIILPATAHIIAQAAHGLANSLLTATILSHPKPILFFPNMNRAMWENPATQRNVSLLQKYGHIVVSPTRKTGFEYASNKMKEDDYMPFPDEAISIIKSEIKKRSSEAAKEEASCVK